MLMSLKNIASIKGYSLLSKDDIAEVVSKGHKKGRSKTGRRQIKRAEKQRIAREVRSNTD
jgi:hypothetical protein